MADKSYPAKIISTLSNSRAGCILEVQHDMSFCVGDMVWLSKSEPVAAGAAEEQFEAYVQTLISKSPEIQKLGARLGSLLDEDGFNGIEPDLLGIARRLSVTEQLASALREVLATVRATNALPDTVMKAESQLDRIRAASKQAEEALRAFNGVEHNAFPEQRA